MSNIDDNLPSEEVNASEQVNADIVPVIVPEFDAERSAGTLVTWHCGEGETISAGAVLADIEAAETVNTLRAPAAGTLRRRLAAEGDMLQEGALIAVLAGDAVDEAMIDEFVIGFATPTVSSEPSSENSETVEHDDNGLTDAPAGALVHETAQDTASTEEATQAGQGAEIVRGAVQAEEAAPRHEEAPAKPDHSMDAAPEEQPAKAVESVHDAGASGPTPVPTETVDDHAEVAGEEPKASTEEDERQEEEPVDRPTVIRKAGSPAPPLEERDPLVASEASMPVSPLARRLAEKLGVDVETIKGTGRNGRVTRRDVELAAGVVPAEEEEEEDLAQVDTVTEEPAIAQADEAYDNPYQSEAVTATHRNRAQDLVARQAIPQTILNADAHVGDLLNARVGLMTETGGDVPLDAFLVRAAALALCKVPKINANLVDEEIRLFKHADIAVALPTEDGMQSQVIRAADTKTVPEIARELDDLVERVAQDGLASSDTTGGTFSLVSLASSGVAQFEPAINPPHVATLALGAPVEQVAVREGNAKITPVMRIALCCDMRAVDLQAGARFLGALTDLLEHPDRL